MSKLVWTAATTVAIKSTEQISFMVYFYAPPVLNYTKGFYQDLIEVTPPSSRDDI